jgi:RNA recognition motif-containing protein
MLMESWAFNEYVSDTEPKHRGFGFVTYTSAGDAQDAIDNMDMNELRGRVLRVNLARPQKAPAVGMGNRPSASILSLHSLNQDTDSLLSFHYHHAGVAILLHP